MEGVGTQNKKFQGPRFRVRIPLETEGVALLFVAGFDAVHLGAGVAATPLDAVLIPAMDGAQGSTVRPDRGLCVLNRGWMYGGGATFLITMINMIECGSLLSNFGS